MTVLGWAIAALTIVFILVRPFRIAEAWWAVGGALLLLLTGAIGPPAALGALLRGVDVYLFLIGMMALAEVARIGGIFDWVASRAIALARGSRLRLLALVFATGITTTALLSNDATIVVLTPAVIAALRRIDAKPMAYVVACALVANAASFVLPISNPSNLLVFAGRMPALGAWFAMFGLASIAALSITFAVLALRFRADLRGNAAEPTPIDEPVLQRAHLIVLAAAAIVIVVTSARSGPLGLTTFACAIVGCAVAAIRKRGAVLAIARGIAWPVVALTAALFVIVTAVDQAGGAAAAQSLLTWCASLPAPGSTLAAGFAVAAASNITNNLPIGLLLGQTLPALHATPSIAAAALVGVNLGPNATVAGSLATILWLGLVRRAGIAVTPLEFALTGIAATVPALAAALLLTR
jgi:arsenical pump membrane protein